MSAVFPLRERTVVAAARPQLDATVDSSRAEQAFGAEQYRSLRHIVEQFGKEGRTIIAITSPIAGDGKTLTSLNLARAMAQSQDARVLLIDADFRRGSLGEQLGLGRGTSAGLAGALASPGGRLAPLLKKVPGSNLSILPAGICPDQPYEALRSARLGEVLKEARETHDYILIDTPPVVPVADVRAISQWVDGFFLVVTAHRTPRSLLDEALSSMEPEKVLGIVYNGDDLPMSRRHRYYYSYGQEASSGFLASLLSSRPGR